MDTEPKINKNPNIIGQDVETGRGARLREVFGRILPKPEHPKTSSSELDGLRAVGEMLRTSPEFSGYEIPDLQTTLAEMISSAQFRHNEYLRYQDKIINGQISGLFASIQLDLEELNNKELSLINSADYDALAKHCLTKAQESWETANRCQAKQDKVAMEPVVGSETETVQRPDGRMAKSFREISKRQLVRAVVFAEAISK
jgi:hypothetical protein